MAVSVEPAPASALSSGLKRALARRLTFVALLGLAGCALIWWTTLWMVRSEREQELRSVYRESANLARAFEEHVRRTLKYADQYLIAAKQLSERRAGNAQWNQFFSQIGLRDEAIGAVSLADERGDIVRTNRPFTAANIADREHFRVHVPRDGGELHVSKPEHERVSGEWTIQLTRRVNRPDGSFGGVVTVGVPTRYLSDYYHRLDLGRLGTVSLVGRDGIVRVLQSGDRAEVGMDISRGNLLQHAARELEGSFPSLYANDAVLRYVSYRAMTDYPLVVSVGRAADEVLAAVRVRETQYLVAAALGTLLLLGLSGALAYGFVTEARDLRQRLAVEQSLREREARVRLVADNVPAMIAYSDTSNRYQYANRACVEFYSRGGTSFEGRLMSEVLGAEIYAAVLPNVERALAGETVRYSANRRGHDGELHRVEVSLVPHREGSGPVLGVYTFIQDVTESYRAAEKLRESERQFRLLTDNVPVLIAHLDENLRFRYANLGYRVFFLGDSAPSMEGMKLQEVAAPEAWQEMRPFIEKAQRGDAASYTAKRRRKSDGSMRELDVSLVPHRSETGKVAGIYVLLIDVTQRRRTEESLRLSNRALEASLNTVNIARIDGGGPEIVYVNPSFERITGYSAAEVVGKNPRFLHREDRDQAGLEVLRRAIRSRSDATVLLRNYRKDGTLFWNELHIAPILDEAGRVTHMLGVGNDVSERIRYQQEVERSANFDGLTGLPNRNLLNDRIAQAIAQAGRSGGLLAVLFIDLDQLKRINDSLGHEMGDKVIVAVGNRIRDALRSGDTVARLGGDEFVALLPELKSEDHATAVVTKVLNFIGTPIRVEAHEFALTASIGVALYPKDGEHPTTLFRNADMALYRAKEDGRNCFRFFAAEMNERVTRFVALEHNLRRALKANQLELHYQPIVSLATGERVGAEALLRWRQADGSLVSPAQFIPVAEDSGLIVPIGQWVMEQAMRQAAEWNRPGRKRLYLSINLSVRQFRDPQLVETLSTSLKRADIDPALITLEITESAVMQSVEQAVRLLDALKALGVKLSVDDFGTGYSSLAYLKRFPIDALKIDRAFVRDVVTDRGDQALSRAIIELGRSLRLAVVAEGIETEEQSRFLAANGCAFAQGYLYGRPMDATAFQTGLATGARRT